MPKTKIKKIIPDDKKHDQSMPLEEKDSESVFGHEPATGSDEVEKDVVDIAHEAGIYEGSTDEGEGKQEEVDIAGQIEKDEKAKWEN